MQVSPLAIDGLFLVTPKRHGDERGWFAEVWRRDALAEAGIETDFVQDNHSYSAEAGTLRGLHYQAPPLAQAKLVRCTRGRILDVAVDIRSGSPTFGKHTAMELSAEDGQQLFMPEGFAHGFLTLTPDCEVQYRVSAPYSPAHDLGIAWDDPAIGINWGLGGKAPILSERDRRHPRLQTLSPVFEWSGT